MTERANTAPDSKGEQLNISERARLEKLYKSALFYTVLNVPFKGGDKSPLNAKLKSLSSLTAESQSGEDLLKLFKIYQKLGLNNEDPVTQRVFIGQLLLKLKTNKTAPGFLPFMRAIAEASRTLKPALNTNLIELIVMLQSMPKSKLRDGRIKMLKNWLGVKKEKDKEEKPSRPDDPLLGGMIYDHLKQDETTGSGYGPLEDITPINANFAGNLDVNNFSVNQLDPFQIILLKEMVKGYNEFVKTIRGDKDIKKLLSYNRPEIIMLKRKLGEAIASMEHWIIQTVKEMKSSKGKQLLPIYKKRVAALKFPSLPAKVTILSPALYRVSVRSKIESSVKDGLRNAIPTMQLISKYIGSFSDVLSRKKMFKTAPNRAFLNRFWTISYTLFKSKKGPEKTKYEFLCMLLDSIKDDKEFVSVLKKMKPIVVDLLRNSSDANKLAKRYLGKDFHQLSKVEVDSLLLLVLPSYILRPKDTKKPEYINIKNRLLGILKDGDISKIKATSQLTYIAITTVVQNLLSISGSLVSETNPVNAKRKLEQFINSFNALRKLIGPTALVKIQKKNASMWLLFNDPKTAIALLKFYEGKTLGKFITRYEKVNKLKKPEAVKEAIDYAKNVKKELERRRQNYIKKMARLQKGKNLTVNYKYVVFLSQNLKQLMKVNKIINNLQVTWDTKQFNAQRAEFKNIMFNTRYLSIPQRFHANMSFDALAKTKRMKRNYSNLVHVSELIYKYMAPQLNSICGKGNCRFAYPRLSKVMKQIIVTYGLQQQAKLGKQDVYTFLTGNSRKFCTEIALRVNNVLKATKFTAMNDKKPSNVYFAGDDVAGYIQSFVDRRITPRAKRAASKRTA